MAVEQSFFKNNDFFASVSKFGVSRPNRFEVKIFSAGNIASSGNADDAMVSLRCQSIELPGRNIETNPNDNVYGPVYEVARGLVLAGTISMSFLLDKKLDVKRYFDEWQKKMYDTNTYDMEYYVDYVRDMNILQLTSTNEIVYNCKVLEVYPKTIDLINLNNDSRSETSMLNVTMAYRDWEEV